MVTIWSRERLAGVPGPRHAAITALLEREVVRGALSPDERLPTQRELAVALGVSLGTVTRAYGEAQSRGLIRGEVGRGTFVGGGTRGLAAAQGSRRGGVDLAVTWPLHPLDPELGPTLRRLAARPDLQELLRYPPHAGLPSHRETGARFIARTGLAADVESVFVCAGVQHALTVVLGSLCETGDTILTEALTYPGLTALARFLRLRVHPVELDAEGIDPDALEAACRRHRPRVLYCVPTLHNPTTRTLSRERRRAIAAVARAHGVAILEDDVHRWLAPSAPMPLASFAPERAYYVGALSKAVTGALRVAFLAAPPENRERLTHSLWATHWTVAPLTAEIVCAWIEDGTAERTAARKRAEASRRQRLAREALRGLQIEGASTAYHIWLSLPEPWTSETFAAEAARQGLAVTPAEAFAVAPKRVPRAVRISLSGTDDREALRGSLARLAAMLRTPSGAVGTL